MHNGYVLVCADHTELHRAQQRLRAILETQDGGVLLIDSDQVHAKLGDPIVFGGEMVSTGASIGVRLLPADASTDASTIFADADHAMYEAKSAGRNQTRIFDHRG